jgi:hypothetical protein|tara:strand:+ start:136 stop:432 length:297 start_codon:yes stop_codon:yes gene_type:complete
MKPFKMRGWSPFTQKKEVVEERSSRLNPDGTVTATHSSYPEGEGRTYQDQETHDYMTMPTNAYIKKYGKSSAEVHNRFPDLAEGETTDEGEPSMKDPE